MRSLHPRRCRCWETVVREKDISSTEEGLSEVKIAPTELGMKARVLSIHSNRKMHARALVVNSEVLVDGSRRRIPLVRQLRKPICEKVGFEPREDDDWRSLSF